MQRVQCPTCRGNIWLQPDAGKTYEDALTDVQKRHERTGCKHEQKKFWGFDPAWDKPPEPKWIRRPYKTQLVEDKKAGVYRLDTKPGDRF